MSKKKKQKAKVSQVEETVQDTVTQELVEADQLEENVESDELSEVEDIHESDAAEPSDESSDGDQEQPDSPPDISPLQDRVLLKRIIEGALLSAAKPMSVQQLSGLFEKKERPAKDDIQSALEDIQNETQGRGFELKEIASGYRFQVVQEVATWVSRMWDEKPQKYSRALLETLSLVAYRQPITRGDIEDIRGVAVSSHIIKTLMEREWIRIVGHKDVPGRPAMFATTRRFLDYFNLKNLDELPTLAEIRDLDSMNEELALEGADTPPIADDNELGENSDSDIDNVEALDGNEEDGDSPTDSDDTENVESDTDMAAKSSDSEVTDSGAVAVEAELSEDTSDDIDDRSFESDDDDQDELPSNELDIFFGEDDEPDHNHIDEELAGDDHTDSDNESDESSENSTAETENSV